MGGKRRKIDAALTPAETTLGKWAKEASIVLEEVGWTELVRRARGTSQLTESVKGIPHKAGRLLDHLRQQGAAVPMRTAPWTQDQVVAAIKRGCHKSAREHTEFVCEELVDFCRQGYWTVLPLEAVLDWPNLRLSPLGVVPQRERRPRLIVDYTFSGVNHDTVRLAPKEAMQFGRALQRVLTQIVHANPRYGPPKLAKIDIADGFYRVWIRIRDIPKLGVLLPRSDGGPELVAFPLALPMGWVESPPYFTTLTETACDLANQAMRQGSHRTQPHHLEAVASTPPPRPDIDDATAPTATAIGDVAHTLVVRLAKARGRIKTHTLAPRSAHQWPSPTYMWTTSS